MKGGVEGKCQVGKIGEIAKVSVLTKFSLVSVVLRIVSVRRQ